MICDGCGRPNVGHGNGGACAEWPKCGACGYSSEPISENERKWKSSNADIRDETGFCCICASWEEHCRKGLEPAEIVVNGTLYKIGNGKKGQQFNGFGGSQYSIQWLADSRIRVIYDLWHEGQLPDFFKHRLPDTARFLPNMPEGFYESTPTQQLCTVAQRLENTK